MNEILLFSHVGIIAIGSLAALKLGKDALVAYTALCCILENLFVTKQVELFGFTITCADALAIGVVLGINLLQEYYVKNAAKKAIYTSFGASLLYTLLAQVHLAYQPSAFDMMHGHFYALLSCMPRIIIASFISYALSQALDYWFFGYLKKNHGSQQFMIRNYISTGLCQFIDTFTFSFLGLYGMVENIWHIIFISYFIKLLVLTLSSPFLLMTTKFAKKDISYETI